MSTMYLGVDGCPAGWIAIHYGEAGYVGAKTYKRIGGLWDDMGDSAETILIDVPIGLREDSADKRPCDVAARKRLSPIRHNSVFPPPVRPAVHEDSYEDAKRVQEGRTEGSLGVQSWGIADKIADLDTFLLETEPTATEVIREAHPEVCFWALNDETPMRFSKTGQPAAAFWERVDALEGVDSGLIRSIRDTCKNLDAEVRLDDIVDAFALALTASPLTGPIKSLPDETPSSDEGDPMGLPMEMVYAYQIDPRGDAINSE